MGANLERHNMEYINGTGKFRNTHAIAALSGARLPARSQATPS